MVLGEGEWEKFGITGRLTTPHREIIHSTANKLGRKLHKNSLRHQELSKQKLDEIIATLEYTAQEITQMPWGSKINSINCHRTLETATTYDNSSRITSTSSQQ